MTRTGIHSICILQAFTVSQESQPTKVVNPRSSRGSTYFDPAVRKTGCTQLSGRSLKGLNRAKTGDSLTLDPLAQPGPGQPALQPTHTSLSL
ncbi:unnamed protein product [Linum tenue]|uniref:Uncharacterized protein n=1 Tax=Linum tenue TaxID=586396 RepID=A0AAV0KRU1_9ROSI|nr:unnamed protein product [Linum tenue]